MSYKQVPITAKILKTTKGGVTQPILNMGAPVKMKAPSVAKQGGRSNKRNRGAASASKPSIKDTTSEREVLKKEISHMSSAMGNYQKKGGEKNASDAGYLKKAKDRLTALQGKTSTTKKVEVAGNVKGKLKPGEGVLKSPKQEAKLTKKQESFIKDPTGGVTKPPKTKSTKITGKIGSDLRRQQYKDKGWADDATTMKPKVKAANTIKAKKGVDVKKARTTSLETKLDPKALKTQVAKVNSKKAEPSKGNVRKANRKLDSADRKDSRASRVSQKAKDARASGNTAKADRLDRRVGRIKKRANKKRGQAAGAIEVK